MIIVDTPENYVWNVDRKLDKIKVHMYSINSTSTLFSCSIRAIYNRVHYAQNKPLVLKLYIPEINTSILPGLFQLQMRIPFPFLHTKDLRTSLLITRTRSFYSPICRGYIRKVSVHLVQKYFPHDCSTDSISCSEHLMKKIS